MIDLPCRYEFALQHSLSMLKKSRINTLSSVNKHIVVCKPFL